MVEIIIARYVIGARIKAVRGDRDAAADRLDDGAHAAAAFGLPRLRAHIDNERMRLDLPFAGPVAHEDALPDGLSGLLPNAFDTASARLPLVVRRDGYLCISVTHPDVIHCAATCGYVGVSPGRYTVPSWLDEHHRLPARTWPVSSSPAAQAPG